MWEIVIELGRKNGKRVRKYHTFHGGKRDAQAYKRELIQEYSKQRVDPIKITVGEYLPLWLEEHIKRKEVSGKPLSQNTIRSYKQTIEDHLIPHLGDVRLQDLEPYHIEDFYTNVNRRDGRAGHLSSTSRLYFHRVLNCALKAAVKKRYISYNPCEAIDDVPRKAPCRYNILTVKEVSKVLQEVRGELHLFVPIYLAVTTGMRRGEIFALKRKDFNLDEGYVWVKKSLSRGQEKGTKSEHSYQPVALLPSSIPVLKKVFREQENQIKLCQGKDEGWVCAWKNGERLNPDFISHKFPELTESMGFGWTRFHDLRHTHASLLMDADVDLKEVSDRLRHGSIDITANTYIHMSLGQKIAVAKAADKKVFRQISESL